MNQHAINVWVGNFGEYEIPNELYQSVKRWKKSGYPYKRDQGRDNFLGWVARQEEAKRAGSCISKVEAGG